MAGTVKLPTEFCCSAEDLALFEVVGIPAKTVALSAADVVIETDILFSPEQYNLYVGSGDPVLVKIRSFSPIGSLHALRTLSQLIAHFGHNLPAMQIDDEPAFPNRGIMLDVSRNRVPKMEELLRLVRQFGSWKINHLQLYTEHTFKYRGHNEVWRGVSPLTPSEIQLLDHECDRQGITLAANQNCFGHMTRWLKHSRYAGLAETHGDWEWEGRQLPGPFSLCPTDPGSIELVDDLLEQLLPNFSSGIVNIGCDETLDVGQGRSKELVAEQGSAALYFDFVRQITELVKKRGFKPMFWADIALSHPEELHRIPDGMISLAWGYESESPFGDWGKRLQEVGCEVWVCPGTSSWRSITGRTTEHQANIRAAVQQGLDNGATGFLMTDWGDEGHRQQWPVSLIGLAESAEVAWSGRPDLPDDFTLDAILFGNSHGVSAWLRNIGDVDLPLRKMYGKPLPDGSPTHLQNSSALFNEMHRPDIVRPASIILPDLWDNVLREIGRLLDQQPVTEVQTSAELRLTGQVAELAAMIAINNVNPEKPRFHRRELQSRLRKIISEHRRLWKLRSRPGGLDESVGYYHKVMQRIDGEIS